MNNGHLISPGEAAFLNLNQLPACLTSEQTATVLGRRPEHIPILVEGGFLKPLGDPPRNGIKVFAACEILERAKDVKWLDKANKCLTRYRQGKNAKSRQPVPGTDKEQSKPAPEVPDIQACLSPETGLANSQKE
jgi:hypothetical protein